MKKIRVLILLLVLVLITGCSGTYDLKIDDDYSVKEEVNLVLENEAKNYEKFNNLLKDNDLEDYKLVMDGNNITLTYSKQYTSIEDYLLNSLAYKQLFDNISYNSDDKEVSLEARNILNTSTSDLNNSYNIKLLQINVITPLDIAEENSDLSSENTYSWTIDNNTQEKDLLLVIDKGQDKLGVGPIIAICSLAIVVIIIIILAVKRLLESNKI